MFFFFKLVFNFSSYLCALSKGGVELAAQLVATLEHRDNATLAAAVRDLHQLVRHPLKVLLDLEEKYSYIKKI